MSAVDPVGLDVGRLVGRVVAALIRRDDAESRLRQAGDLLVPRPPEFGIAVQQDHRWSVRRAGLDDMQPDAVGLDQPRARARRHGVAPSPRRRRSAPAAREVGRDQQRRDDEPGGYSEYGGSTSACRRLRCALSSFGVVALSVVRVVERCNQTHATDNGQRTATARSPPGAMQAAAGIRLSQAGRGRNPATSYAPVRLMSRTAKAIEGSEKLLDDRRRCRQLEDDAVLRPQSIRVATKRLPRPRDTAARAAPAAATRTRQSSCALTRIGIGQLDRQHVDQIADRRRDALQLGVRRRHAQHDLRQLGLAGRADREACGC